MTKQLTKDLPAGITHYNGKYRVTKRFLGKNYSFGTIARLHDAKCINKNVDAIIAFAREGNNELINENISLKCKITELEKKINDMELWALENHDKLEESKRLVKSWKQEAMISSLTITKQTHEINRLKNRGLWQRFWNMG